MSEGATGSAPAAAPAAAPAQSTAPVEKKDGAQEWSDADDAEVFSRLARAPWAKVKADGKETPIKSKEDFLAFAMDASRGRGANKLVEETKKEREAARKEKAETESFKAMLRRAQEGDSEAFEKLGLSAPEKRKAEMEAFEKLPPEVQELVRENMTLKQRQQQEAAAAKAREAEEQGRQKEARKAETLQKAREVAKDLLKDVKEELHDVELPEIVAGMRELLQTGMRIGRDYSPEQLARFVQERRTAALDSRVSTLTPAAQMRLVLPTLKQLATTPEGVKMLEEILGGDFDAIATPLAQRRYARWKSSKSAEALGGDVKPAERKPSTVSQPLPWQKW